MGGTLLALLILALAVELGRAVAERTLSEREPLVTGAYAFVLGLASVGLLGNLLYRTTLRIDWTLLLLPGCLLAARVAAGRWRGLPADPEAAPPLGGRARMVAAVLAVVVSVPMALVLAKNHLWDEWETHLPIAASIANGVYPPVYPYLPDTPVSYHFGFDLLAGLTGRATGLPLDRIFDLLSTLLFLAYFLGLAGLLRAHSGGRALPFVLAGALVWLGGLSWLRALAPHGLRPEHLEPLLARTNLDGYLPLVASPASFFLQKPMALGLCVWVVALPLIVRAERAGDLGAAAVAGLVLGFLELAQASLFAVTAAATLGYALVGPLCERRRFGRTPLTALVVVGTAVGVALLGGAFLADPSAAGLDVVWRPRFPFAPRTRPDQGHPLLPYLWHMGLPILAAPLCVVAVLRRPVRLPLMLVLLAGGSFAVAHLFDYPRGVSIRKFLVVAMVGFGLLTALEVARAATRLPRRWALALTALTVLAMGGLAVPWTYYFLRVTPAWDYTRVDPHVALDAEVVAFLRGRADPRDRVLTSSIYPSALGGLLTPLPTFYGDPHKVVSEHAFPQAAIDETSRAVERALRFLDPVALARLRIRWIILGDEDLPRLEPQARVQLAEARRFQKVLELARGSLRRVVYQYQAGPPPGGR